jgi:hypothetical protein
LYLFILEVYFSKNILSIVTITKNIILTVTKTKQVGITDPIMKVGVERNHMRMIMITYNGSKDGGSDGEVGSGRISHDKTGSGKESENGRISDKKSDSGRKSQGDVKGKTLFVGKSSDEESGASYNTINGNLKKRRERFASLNDDALRFLVENGISDGTRFYFSISLGDTLLYTSMKHLKVNLQMVYEKRGTNVPLCRTP